MGERATLAVELEPTVLSRLTERAAGRKQDAATLAADVITEWVAIDDWQRAEIEAGLLEADAGDFAPDEDVRAVMERWRRPLT